MKAPIFSDYSIFWQFASDSPNPQMVSSLATKFAYWQRLPGDYLSDR